MTEFAGFPKEGLQFFKKLRKNNDRDWFEANKETYLAKVRLPMEDLVSRVNAELAKFAPDYMTEPKKAIYRIYRDTRFSRDKTPYKTHIAANFPLAKQPKRKGAEKHAQAGFYFSVSDEEIEIAGGVYMPGPEELAAIRAHISEHGAELKKIATNRKLVALMGGFQGEALRKVPRGYSPEHPQADYIRMKQWMFFKTFEPGNALSTDLPKFVGARFKAIAPLVAFLNAPLAKKNPPSNVILSAPV